MSFRYLEDRLVGGELRLGIVLHDGTWRMLLRGIVSSRSVYSIRIACHNAPSSAERCFRSLWNPAHGALEVREGATVAAGRPQAPTASLPQLKAGSVSHTTLA